MRTLFFALLITGLLIAGAGCKKDAACAFSFFISKSYTQTDVNGNIKDPQTHLIGLTMANGVRAKIPCSIFLMITTTRDYSNGVLTCSG